MAGGFSNDFSDDFDIGSVAPVTSFGIGESVQENVDFTVGYPTTQLYEDTKEN